MLGLLKFLFYLSLSIAVGVLIGTVRIGGYTVADRLVKCYETGSLSELIRYEPTSSPKAEPKREAMRDAKREVQAPAQPPVTPGQANQPEQLTAEERAALEKRIAERLAR